MEPSSEERLGIFVLALGVPSTESPAVPKSTSAQRDEAWLETSSKVSALRRSSSGWDSPKALCSPLAGLGTLRETWRSRLCGALPEDPVPEVRRLLEGSPST